jgi:hypothetical protein
MLVTQVSTRGDAPVVARAEEDEVATPALAPLYSDPYDAVENFSVGIPQAYSLGRSGGMLASKIKIKLGGGSVGRVDRGKLDTYLDQLEEETAKWAKAHPLNPRDKSVPEEEELE